MIGVHDRSNLWKAINTFLNPQGLMGSNILLSLLFIISLTAQAAATENQTAAVQPNEGISLNGTNLIRAPEISFAMPGLNWMYQYSYYPIYSEGQDISGLLASTNKPIGANVSLCVSGFNLSRFLNASALDIAKGRCSMLPNKLKGNFTLHGLQSGTYTLAAIDEHNSTVLSELPLIVTAQKISINSSAKVVAGDTLKVAIKMEGSDNLTKYYGAAMVSSKDYDEIKLHIASNGSYRNLSSTIAFGNRSMNIKGLPSISAELLMKLFTILPQDSAVSMQVSSKPEVEVYLVTDPGMEHGSYVLTCIVYSPGKGILGMRQIPIEVA